MSYFFKHHFIITKDLMQKNGMADKDHLPPLFKIEECTPNAAYFNFVFQRVGGPWKWTERPKYKNAQAELRARLRDPKTRMFNLKKGEKLVGYCLATASEEDVAKQYKNPIEIENFGLFLEYTNMGYGNFFLQGLFQELLKQYDTIYLSTRSTNHAKVVPFYQKNGMILVKSERKMDDLLPAKMHEVA